MTCFLYVLDSPNLVEILKVVRRLSVLNELFIPLNTVFRNIHNLTVLNPAEFLVLGKKLRFMLKF